MADILTALKEDQNMAASSPDHKKARSAEARSAYPPQGNLSTAEVLLQHDMDIRQLHAAMTVAVKLPVDNELGKTLQQGVRVWQKQHQKGKPHPFGSCSTAVATLLMDSLCKMASENPKTQNDQAVQMIRHMLELQQPSVVAQEISHCSCRLNSKESHFILELRLHNASTLYCAFPWMRLCLIEAGGELLGPKAPPSWARRVRAM